MNAVPHIPEWSPSSWTSRPAQQQPSYRDPVALNHAVDSLGRLPPIVVSWEVEALRQQIAEAQRGERFLLQGGIAPSPLPTATRARSPASSR
ncbi:MAG: 3-deoxy-7-phosphoheptulonate synthase, partial [Steroidobacteraceae bacterium]